MTKAKKKKLVEAAIAFLLSFPATVWSAWVGKTLWTWFAVPLGAPAIGIAWCYGLTMLGISLRPMATTKTGEDRGPLEELLDRALTAAIILLAGWIAHLVMVSS